MNQALSLSSAERLDSTLLSLMWTSCAPQLSVVSARLAAMVAPQVRHAQSEAGARARLCLGSTGPGQSGAGQRRAELRAPHSPGSQHRGHPHLGRHGDHQ